MFRAMPLAGCFRFNRSSTLANFSRSSASSIVSTLVPMIGTPALESPGQVQRRLPAELHDTLLCVQYYTLLTITPSGWMRSQILSTSSVVSGSKNSRSLVS